MTLDKIVIRLPQEGLCIGTCLLGDFTGQKAIRPMYFLKRDLISYE
jgi:hypothetical protein